MGELMYWVMFLACVSVLVMATFVMLYQRQINIDLRSKYNDLVRELNNSFGWEEWYWDNSELFALSWVNGYTVEKEKRYLVKMKGMDKEFTMLKLDKIRGSWYLGNDNEYSYTKTAHTHKELEEAGFGEVLNSPLFEVEEVEV